jgi:membrane-associated protease RseP (regulator of RpoE activity)
LNGKSFARIGDAYVPAIVGNVREWIADQGRRVGADRILIYAPGSDGVTHASYYIRYRLPFGATFRTVSAEEREMLGSGGVQIGDVVAGTPASEANLLKGDFIVKFDGRAFADRAAFEKLLREHLGARVTLTISRNGAVLQRLVRLGSIARPAGDLKQ